MAQGYGQNWWIVRTFGKQQYLLLSLLMMLILLPILTAEDASPIWRSALMTVIMITGPLSIATRPISFYVSLALAVITVANSWLGHLPDFSQLKSLGTAATVAVFPLLAVQIFRVHLISKAHITAETLIAAINAYICMGIMYAFAYDYLLNSSPGTFSMAIDQVVNFNTAVYLSFVTLTTLGYGDITPLTEVGMILTWSEALAGQLYIALTIARIVGVMIAREQ